MYHAFTNQRSCLINYKCNSRQRYLGGGNVGGGEEGVKFVSFQTYSYNF